MDRLPREFSNVAGWHRSHGHCGLARRNANDWPIARRELRGGDGRRDYRSRCRCAGLRVPGAGVMRFLLIKRLYLHAALWMTNINRRQYAVRFRIACDRKALMKSETNDTERRQREDVEGEDASTEPRRAWPKIVLGSTSQVAMIHCQPRGHAAPRRDH
jgi:hypothetical protein